MGLSPALGVVLWLGQSRGVACEFGRTSARRRLTGLGGQRAPLPPARGVAGRSRRRLRPYSLAESNTVLSGALPEPTRRISERHIRFGAAYTPDSPLPSFRPQLRPWRARRAFLRDHALCAHIDWWQAMSDATDGRVLREGVLLKRSEWLRQAQ